MPGRNNVTISEIRKMVPGRSLFSDKNSARLVIIGGSGEYYGAPVLAANSAYNSLAALRSGAGYVSIFVPKQILRNARSFSPVLVVKQSGMEFVELTTELKHSINMANAVIIGMGIGSNANALREALKIMNYAVSHEKKIIIDADAILLIHKLKKRTKDIVITPNDSEFYRLSGIKPSRNDVVERVTAAKAISKRFGVVVALKGHINVISDGTRVKVIQPKSAALATMGTGDVLSGIIGAFLAMGTDAFYSAVASIYVHSIAGDMLYKEKGSHIIATDVINIIPEAIKRATGRK